MAELDAKELLKRYQRAKDARAPWDSLLREAFRYAAPDFDTGFQALGSSGQDRRVHLFDSTAPLAVEDSAAATQQTLTPATETFVRLEPSPADARGMLAGADERTIEDFRRVLDEVTEAFFSHLNASNFHEVAGTAYVQEAISTGVLIMNEAPAGAPSAFEFEAVPLADVFPEQAPGSVWRTVWRRMMKTPAWCVHAWPKAALPKDLSDLLRDKPDEAVELVDGAVWDGKAGTWTYVVLWPRNDGVILLRQEQASSPFLDFRSQTAPGEMLGRGRVLAALADIKCANKVVELLLKNASIAVTGIWQADDDGVINPATIKLVPGTIIPKAVGSKGLQPLEAPGNFDVAELTLSDLRRRIRVAIVGPELPEMTASARATATEMDYRWSEVQLLKAPRLLRLMPTVTRMVKRGLDILARRGAVPELPGVGTQIRVLPVSRMMQMQHLADVIRARSAMAMAIETFPDAVGRNIDVDKAVRWMLRKGGWPEELMASLDATAAAGAQQGQQLQLQRIAELAKSSAPMVKALAPGGVDSGDLQAAQQAATAEG